MTGASGREIQAGRGISVPPSAVLVVCHAFGLKNTSATFQHIINFVSEASMLFLHTPS